MRRDKTLVAFGREVRRRRQARGLTLLELAEEANISMNFLGGIENARRNPSLTSMAKIAAGLGAPLRDLLGAPEMSADAIEAARFLSALPAEVREPVVNALRTLAAWAWRRP